MTLRGRAARSRRCRCALALILAASLAGVLAKPARAGSYDVVACGAGAGGAQNAFASVADAQMAAYNVCPNTPSSATSGIVTRASAGPPGSSVPYFAGAYQIFEAPAGAALESVTFDVAAIRLASYWTTGIVAYDRDFNTGELPYGCYAGRPGCGIGTSSFFGPVTVPLNGHARFRFETRCVNPGRCDISGSGFQPATRALFSAANVRVRVRDSTRPSIVPAWGSLWRNGWHRGIEDSWQMVTDNVGVMGLRLYVDGAVQVSQDDRAPEWPANFRCDFTRPRPCSDITPGGVSLDTRTLADGPHRIRIEAVDAAGDVGAIERTIMVDNTAPPHVSASVEGGEQWRTSNQFTVRLTPPGAQLSPVAKVHYLICSSNGASCARGTRSGASIDRVPALGVPAPGAYTVRAWLEDEAGNTDASTATDPIWLRFDDRAPEATFELLDENDPRHIAVRLTDTESGVAGGSVEIRRIGHRHWHELPSQPSASGLSAFVDDLALPDGAYELRSIVRDHAGNERVGDRREDGAPMQIGLPLRPSSRLSLAASGPRARCKRTRRRRARRQARRCRRGAGSRPLRGFGTIQGILQRGDGSPIAGARIDVIEQPRVGVALVTAVVRSDGGGRFLYRTPPGPSRTVRFSYAGTPVVKPVTKELAVLTPAATTIRTDRRRLRNGERMTITGRLIGGPVPDGGKLIDLQAHYRKRWRTFAAPRTDANGRWSFRYRFEATTGVVTYAFRARIRREAAYPYELGYSHVVKVTVRGP
jgi:hypothetical protein